MNSPRKQNLHNLNRPCPWGENLYEYNTASEDYNSPYRFNAKELDPEPDNYYGAHCPNLG